MSAATVETARIMARYNAWQNASLTEAAGGLGDAARDADRGAFFGSIATTFAHVQWGGRMWMSRLEGWDRPEGAGVGPPTGWARFREERAEVDAGIVAWAEGLDEAADPVGGPLTWWSGATGRDVTRARALCVLHMFNHQTHHRGQIHAMLTAAGARPGVTDLAFMP